jgi:hypothetical protein
MSRARFVSRWASTVLAVVGWAGMVWSYIDHGFGAGIDPGFIAAGCVAVAFTCSSALFWALPHREARDEQAAVYGLGYAAGMSCGACPLRRTPDGSEPSRPPLEVVR